MGTMASTGMNVSCVAGNAQDAVHGARVQALVAFFDDGDGDAVAGLDLFDIGQHLVVQRRLGGEADHGDARLDQRQRAVLHLAGGIGLGVDVGDFFELQRRLPCATA